MKAQQGNSMIRWFDDLVGYRRFTTVLRSMRGPIESYLARAPTNYGYCCARERIESFTMIPPEDGWYNLRESFVCECGLNGRMRMMYQAFANAMREYAAMPMAMLFERLSPLYAVLSERYPSVRGCEYVSADAIAGRPYRVRDIEVIHEDMQALSIRDGSMNLVCHLDVLEHVPDHRKALAECARVLAPGGRLLFTCPFYEFDSHITRAVVEHGQVRHLLPPGYHGNPLSAQGSLVFTQFGSPLLGEIRAAGFREARIGVFYEPFQGIVSNANPYPEGFMWPVLFEGVR